MLSFKLIHLIFLYNSLVELVNKSPKSYCRNPWRISRKNRLRNHLKNDKSVEELLEESFILLFIIRQCKKSPFKYYHSIPKEIVTVIFLEGSLERSYLIFIKKKSQKNPGEIPVGISRGIPEKHVGHFLEQFGKKPLGKGASVKVPAAGTFGRILARIFG